MPKISDNNVVKLYGIITPQSDNLGLFSESGDMYFFDNDVSRLVTLFNSFCQNRMLYEQKQHFVRKT